MNEHSPIRKSTLTPEEARANGRKGGRPRADGKPNKNGLVAKSALASTSTPAIAAAAPPTPAKTGVVIQMGKKFVDTLYAPGVRHKAFFGGRGSGKSYAVATYLVIEAAKRKLKIVCARQFQNSIRDSSKEVLEKRIAALGLQGYVFTERSIIHIGTGSEFLFVGLERNVDSIRSLEGSNIVWIEEARMIKAKSMEILLPTVREPGSELIWCWNPELPTDPVDQYFRNGAPPPRAIVTEVDYRDNPYFLRTELPAEMEALRLSNYERYKHVWLGEYDLSYQTKVFTNVLVGRVEVPADLIPVYGLDFGFGQDPSFIVKAYILRKTKQIYIAAEASGAVTMEQLPDLVRSVIHHDSDLVRADSSQPGTIEFLQSRGLNIQRARKGPGSVKSGILFLQGFQLVVDPACDELREEARLYSWVTDRLTGQALSIPVDANNHGFDALRYATEDAQTDGDGGDDDGGVLRIKLW
jgi:phage terminase large subunit